MGRADDAVAAENKALTMASQQQVHSFARNLQGIGQQDQALAIFRINIRRDPNSWIAHSEQSRLAVATGDFDAAVKEAKRAVDAAPDSVKSQLADFVRQLENKVDINK